MLIVRPPLRLLTSNTRSLLLEVRKGDDLYQVAQWHCHRHSLGQEKVSVLSARLEQVSRGEHLDTFVALMKCPYVPSYYSRTLQKNVNL